MNLLWKLLLGPAWLRRRLLFQVKQNHLDDLGLCLPIGQGLSVPFFNDDIGSSFSEIFLDREYGALPQSMSLPDTWIDLGCHSGFFSLWIEWMRRKQGLSIDPMAILVDADPAVLQVANQVVEVNGLGKSFTVMQGAVADPTIGSHATFYSRPYMASSLSSGDGPGRRMEVPILSPEKLLALMPATVDLVKVDIEGGEMDLLGHYGEVLKRAKLLLIEVHYPPTVSAPFHWEVEQLGFKCRSVIRAKRNMGRVDTELILFANASFPESGESARTLAMRQVSA